MAIDFSKINLEVIDINTNVLNFFSWQAFFIV